MSDYRRFVNGRQTRQERKTKYAFLRQAGCTRPQAIKRRDWTHYHVAQYVSNNRAMLKGQKRAEANKNGRQKHNQEK